jgi:predicted small secreted protein
MKAASSAELFARILNWRCLLQAYFHGIHHLLFLRRPDFSACGAALLFKCRKLVYERLMKSESYIKLGVVLVAFIHILLTSGCATAEGFGRDVEHTGEVIQRETR